MRRRLIVALLAGIFSAAAVGHAETINVAAAISMKEALDDVAKAYKAGGGDDVTFTLGASGQLLTQIKNGADIDLYVSAAEGQVDAMVKEKLGDAATRKVVARNALVIVVPADSKLEIKTIADIARAKRISIGEPKSVPAGEYASQALAANKLELKDKIVFGANVRQVLDYVIKGEVDVGFVYATDARQAGDKVKVALTVDEKDHKPITYPAIVVSGSKKAAAAKKFLDYLGSDAAAKYLTERGFVPASAAK